MHTCYDIVSWWFIYEVDVRKTHPIHSFSNFLFASDGTFQNHVVLNNMYQSGSPVWVLHQNPKIWYRGSDYNHSMRPDHWHFSKESNCAGLEKGHKSQLTKICFDSTFMVVKIFCIFWCTALSFQRIREGYSQLSISMQFHGQTLVHLCMYVSYLKHL